MKAWSCDELTLTPSIIERLSGDFFRWKCFRGSSLKILVSVTRIALSCCLHRLLIWWVCVCEREREGDGGRERVCVVCACVHDRVCVVFVSVREGVFVNVSV